MIQLTKTLKKEILDNYDKWLHSYLNGDINIYNSYFDDNYHFIGSTNSEEFLTRKDTTNFFKKTADQLAGKTDLRNETKTIELFDNLVFMTHTFDAWFLNGDDWTYYSRFRFSSVMQKKAQHWKFIYQHFSVPDSKTDDGETIGFDKVNLENQELKEAIKRRTFELEEKNRELQVEGALERIRAQAVAMKQSSDLLDIVVTMRNEFIKLGHEAHYFWHMMWLPEKYEKAMTSGDGTKIGFVMTLPRHIHGDIPQLAKWEKSKKPTVVHAMNVEDALDYIHKMVMFGDFQNIDPQAPTEDDIRHIGGLTFVMARTSHGEIGYSLPGVVKNPPKEDINILVKFAGAFDLAHQRFLDLQNAEKQARENQIELALERVRAKTMSMQRSDELKDTSLLLFQQVEELGINSFACGFNIWDDDKKFATAWMAGKDRLQPPFRTNSSEDVYRLFHEAEKRGDALFVLEQEGKKLEEHYKYLVSIPEVKALAKAGLAFPTFQIIHCAYFSKGYLMFITHEPVPDAHDIFKRFAKVFEQTYTRFLDLQKAESQARESEIELALERVRARTMAMQHSDELQEASFLLDQQVRALGIKTWGSAFNINGEKESTEWFGNEAGVLPTYTVPREGIFKEYYQKGQKGESLIIKEFSGKACVEHYEYMSSLPVIGDVLKNLKKANNGFPIYQIDHVVFFKYGYLLFITKEHVPESHAIFKRFAKVFEQTYTRFLDLQKAEAQAREAQIETSLERIRSRSMAMQKSSELLEAGELLWNEITKLGIECFTSGYILMDENEDIGWNYTPNPSTGKILDQAIGIPHQQTPPMRKILAGWKKDEPLSVIELTRKQTIAHQTFVAEKGINFPFSTKELIEISPKEIVIHTFNFKQGYLMIIGSEKLANTQIEVMLRFTKVFQQTYTRFLDLKKAEAQARESQIEVAVERIRAQSMAMHHPDDLKNVYSEIYKQLQLLNINGLTGVSIWLVDENDYVKIWDLSSPGNMGNPNSYSVAYDASKYDILGEPVRILKNLKENYFVLDYPLEKLHKAVKEWSLADKAVANDIKDAITTGKLSQQWNPFAQHNNGLFSIDLLAPPNEDTKKIVTKIASAFNQAYTRFLDLQKAETQAREAHIEAALERTRTQSMLMQHSDELNVTAQVFHHQLQLLGIDSEFSYLWLPDEEEKTHKFWTTWSDTKKGKTIFNNKTVSYPLDKNEPSIAACYVAWESEEIVHVNTVQTDKVEDYFNTWSELLNSVDKFKPELFPDGLYYIDAYMKYGCFGIMIKRQLSEDEKNILSRFSKEFQRTYTRFLDLQKAEAQAREAKIEAALEKIRSRTMAMQKGEELQDVVVLLYKELIALGVTNFAACGYVEINKETNRQDTWVTNAGGDSLGLFHLPLTGDVHFDARYDAWKNQQTIFHQTVAGKVRRKHLEYAVTTFESEEAKDMVLNQFPEPTVFYCFNFSHGYLHLVADSQLTQDEEALLAKFTKVFEQTYARFLDLKKAEAQAKEAQIETALEKVRSRSLAMHKPDELQEVVAVVAEKLKDLGVIFDAGGVILCTYFPDNKDIIHWISADDFSYSGSYLVPYFENPIFDDAWESKLRGDAYFSKEFSVEAKNHFFTHCFEHSGYRDFPEEFKQHALLAEKHRLTAAWSKNSAILIPSLTGVVPSESDANILKRFAKVFEQAYIRFKDIKIKEKQSIALLAEKKRIEIALSDLQATQKQLIQSEKMASLGELTAGIAHEIQNPLNFVNNFSEVSSELIDEMNEELDKGDIKEAKEISEDIKQNLEKINHHGKRADDIIKGMLQHSRSSSGTKEPTDINKLTDEYFRLAYHGLRAKDKSFNATLETDYDERINSIDIIPQDIGRVILNLFTNAFYAVDEKSSNVKTIEDNYKPTVSVSTKKLKDGIVIKVRDNGNGIQKGALDKIFQPFFTTKPTGKGTGLGLSMSYDIIKAHDGELEVETEEGNGTTFTIELPIRTSNM